MRNSIQKSSPFREKRLRLCVLPLVVLSVAVVCANAVAGTLCSTQRLKNRRATGDLLKYLLAAEGPWDSVPY